MLYFYVLQYMRELLYNLVVLVLEDKFQLAVSYRMPPKTTEHPMATFSYSGKGILLFHLGSWKRLCKRFFQDCDIKCALYFTSTIVCFSLLDLSVYFCLCKYTIQQPLLHSRNILHRYMKRQIDYAISCLK